MRRGSVVSYRASLVKILPAGPTGFLSLGTGSNLGIRRDGPESGRADILASDPSDKLAMLVQCRHTAGIAPVLRQSRNRPILPQEQGAAGKDPARLHGPHDLAAIGYPNSPDNVCPR